MLGFFKGDHAVGLYRDIQDLPLNVGPTRACIESYSGSSHYAELASGLFHVSHWSLGKGNQGNPTRPFVDY